MRVLRDDELATIEFGATRCTHAGIPDAICVSCNDKLIMIAEIRKWRQLHLENKLNA